MEKLRRSFEKAGKPGVFADFGCLGIPKSAKTLGFANFFKPSEVPKTANQFEKAGETKRFG